MQQSAVLPSSRGGRLLRGSTVGVLGLTAIAMFAALELGAVPPFGATWLPQTMHVWTALIPLLALSVLRRGNDGTGILDRYDILCAAIVVVVVGITRLISFSTWPPNYEMFEEIQLGAVGWSIATRGETPPQFLSTDITGAFALLAGPHTFTGLRTPFLAATILAAGVWYAALRHYASRTASLAGVCMMLTAPTAALMAPIADEYLFPLTLVPVMLWGIMHALRCNRLSGSVVAGIACGFLFYEHDAYKPFVAAGFVVAAVGLWRAPRRAIWHFAFGLLAFLIVTLPALMDITDEESGLWLWEGIWRHTQGLHAMPSATTAYDNAQLILTVLFTRADDWSNAVAAPILGLVGGCLVAVGLAVGLVAPRSLCGVAVAIAAALFAGCAIIPMNVVPNRLIVFFVPAVLAVVGLLDPVCRDRRRAIGVVVAAALAVAVNLLALRTALSETPRYEEAEQPINLVLGAILETPPERYVILWWETVTWDPFGNPADAEWLLGHRRGEVFSATTRSGAPVHGPTRWIVVNAPRHAQEVADSLGCSIVRRPSLTHHTTVDLVDCG